jgi:hypothetical protein
MVNDASRKENPAEYEGEGYMIECHDCTLSLPIEGTWYKRKCSLGVIDRVGKDCRFQPILSGGIFIPQLYSTFK